MADVEKPRHRRSTAIEVFSPEEILALVREADSEQDGAIYLTAAFTGLRRGELVATSTSQRTASASAGHTPAAS
jgi:integrase